MTPDYESLANRILFASAYFDERRGFLPMGEKLWKCLDAKSQYVRLAWEAASKGEPWTDQEFVDLCFGGFEELLTVASERTHTSDAPA